MNDNINTQVYAQKVELLLRLMPIVMEDRLTHLCSKDWLSAQIKKRFLPLQTRDIDGTYFGHYIQWVFLFFFYIGMFAAFSLVGVWIAKAKGWL